MNVSREQLERVRQVVRDSRAAWKKLCPKHGPCWPISYALAAMGWGHVYHCKTWRYSTARFYSHYVVKSLDGSVLDVSGEYLDHHEPKWATYRNFKRFDDFHVGAYTPAHVEFWRAALADTARLTE